MAQPSIIRDAARCVEFHTKSRRSRKINLASRLVFFTLTLLLQFLVVEHKLFVVCYIRSLPSTTTSRIRHDASFQLHSSPNIFRGLTLTSGDDDDKNEKKKKAHNKIEFVDFWGKKISSIDDNNTIDPRQIPCVPTLDVRDGPLPRGAYVLEGSEEFDAKSTCRIAIQVKTGPIDSSDDADEIVKRLQACIDAGFDTFELPDQTTGMDIIRRMNEKTPSYINRHWSVDFKIQSISPDANTLSTKSHLRQTILDLVEQTGSDALDSLKVDCGPTKKRPLLSDEAILETFEHLVDLQREGWIRSIGVRNLASEDLRRNILNYFGCHIDFEEQEGNLLLPPSPMKLLNTPKNIRMSNALAGGLLTDLYNKDRRRRKTNHPSEPIMTKENIQLLREWAKQRDDDDDERERISTMSVGKEYQTIVMDQLAWIATKHDVSISAVALRWALECGGNTAPSGEAPVVSTAVAELDLEDPNFYQTLIELRQVFRFQLDEEDLEILSEISPGRANEFQNGKEGFPDIDFNNPTLWL